MTPLLAVTMGDPAGIGGEITLKAWRAGAPPFLLLADPTWLATVDPSTPIRQIQTPDQAAAIFPEAIPVLPIPLAEPARPGHPSPANAPAIIESIRAATALAQSHQVDAIVTNPIAKHVLTQSGFKHPGHTEYLGHLTGAPTPVMMLANDHLRVVPVTVHVSLRAALDQLDTASIVAQGRILAETLRTRFNIPNPRIAVAGLNPHAGESGTLGSEETTIIAPAIAQLRAHGVDATGPYPPDALFTPAARPNYDAALCMYHDQALIPLKALDVASGVNVTIGLPIIRTSPDHGTAFDIAGLDRADPTSLLAALNMAATMASSADAGPPP